MQLIVHDHTVSVLLFSFQGTKTSISFVQTRFWHHLIYLGTDRPFYSPWLQLFKIHWTCSLEGMCLERKAVQFTWDLWWIVRFCYHIPNQSGNPPPMDEHDSFPRQEANGLASGPQCCEYSSEKKVERWNFWSFNTFVHLSLTSGFLAFRMAAWKRCISRGS